LAHTAHPLPAPWAWVEEGHHAKGTTNGETEGSAEYVTANQLGGGCVVGIEQIIAPTECLFFDAVGNSPVQEGWAT